MSDYDIVDPDPEDAAKALKEAAARAGLHLPDLGVDCCIGGLKSGRGEHDEGCRRDEAPVPLVCLGAASASTTMKLAKFLAAGAESCAAGNENRPEPPMPVLPRSSRHVHMTVTPDLGDNSPPICFVMQCNTCGQQSKPAADSEPLLNWALIHAGSNAEHRRFAEVITRPYRAFETDSVPKST